SASVVRKAERDSGREPYVRPSRMKVPLGVSKTANGYSPRVVVETNKPSSSTRRQLPSGRVVRTLDPAEKGRCSSSSQTTVKPSMSSIRPLPARSAWVRAPKQRAPCPYSEGVASSLLASYSLRLLYSAIIRGAEKAETST